MDALTLSYRIVSYRSLMSLLNIPHRLFPHKSYPHQPAHYPDLQRPQHSMGRSFRETPCEPARWIGMSGRMANPAPNTGYEPNPSNFFSYMETEHTPINLPATVISTTDPEGLPHSGASSSSSKQTAASRVPLNVRDLQAAGNRWQVMCRVVWASRKHGQYRTENLLQQRFLVHSRKGEISRHKRCAFVERQSKSPKNP